MNDAATINLWLRFLGFARNDILALGTITGALGAITGALAVISGATRLSRFIVDRSQTGHPSFNGRPLTDACRSVERRLLPWWPLIPGTRVARR